MQMISLQGNRLAAGPLPRGVTSPSLPHTVYADIKGYSNESQSGHIAYMVPSLWEVSPTRKAGESGSLKHIPPVALADAM